MKTRGYTLVEILVSVFILSVLAMIAIPWALDYQLRAKIAEGVVLVGPLKNLITEHFINYSQLPVNSAELNIPAETTFRGNWTASVVVTDTPAPGSIIITFDTAKLPQLEGNNTLQLIPAIQGEHLIWRCGGGSLKKRLRPSSCRDES